MFKVHIGKKGLDETWQADFPETIKCSCNGEARHAFTAREEYEGKGDYFVANLYRNKNKAFWPHDCIAVAIYFCKKCAKTLAKFNQA